MSTQHRILVVDDEPKVAFFFQQHLEIVGEGYLATAVNSGEEALKELKKYHYNLMITDLRMPKMDGLELLRRVRQLSPDTKTILVTAYGTKEVWEEARRLDISRSLSKPTRIPDLLQAVRQALKENAQQDEAAANSGILALTGERFEMLATSLETLRVDVGAHATIIADTTGSIIIYAGNIGGIDTSSMMALLGSTMAASSELSHQLKYPEQIHLSYFEGPPYDLYATNLGDDFFLTIIQKRGQENSRIGTVWLYTRRALSRIIDLLYNDGGVGESTVALEKDFAQSVQNELDDFFTEPEDAVSGMTKPTATLSKTAVSPTKTISPLQQRIQVTLEKINQKTDLLIDYQLDTLANPLSPEITRLILQTVNVTLKNTLMYAKARKVSVTFNQDGGTLRGLIVDDGIGLDKKAKSNLKSLATLQQQYENLNGKLEIFAFPSKGTTVMVQIPT